VEKSRPAAEAMAPAAEPGVWVMFVSGGVSGRTGGIFWMAAQMEKPRTEALGPALV
jgi:hypothetical protein